LFQALCNIHTLYTNSLCWPSDMMEPSALITLKKANKNVFSALSLSAQCYCVYKHIYMITSFVLYRDKCNQLTWPYNGSEYNKLWEDMTWHLIGMQQTTQSPLMLLSCAVGSSKLHSLHLLIFSGTKPHTCLIIGRTFWTIINF